MSDASLEPQDVVLRFLEYAGKPAESRFYLDLFRRTPREQFAAIAIDANVMADAVDAVVLDLKFLAALDLFPTVVLGLFQPADAAAHARRLKRRLDGAAVRSETFSSREGDLASRIAAASKEDAVPIVVFEPHDAEQPADRLARLGDLLKTLRARKLLFLHRPGGLRSRGALLPLVNLSTDVPALLAAKDLSRKEALIVEHARRLCDELHPFSVAVTSPINVLRELFTVKGAGTLLRRGARIVRHEGWDGVDVERVRALLASSFGRPAGDAFFERTPSRTYLEEDYRGCAILVDVALGAYLTKFAVTPEAQGEGIARELWDDVVAENPVIFWRARAANPIGDWYAKLCDGLARFPDWTVYWRGLAPARIPEAIASALAQPIDVPSGDVPAGDVRSGDAPSGA
jgi:GNAT superfamily N-acetyltransferase